MALLLLRQGSVNVLFCFFLPVFVVYCMGDVFKNIKVYKGGTKF